MNERIVLMQLARYTLGFARGYGQAAYLLLQDLTQYCSFNSF
jgi:hypothetical protein